jgi:hypothetical protein
MKTQSIKLISILLLGFVLLFSNVQQVNFLSLQNRRAINLVAETNSLQLKKESLLLQNNTKFVAEIDKKIEKNEVQQIVVGISNNQSFDEDIKKQNIPTSTNNTTIVAR